MEAVLIPPARELFVTLLPLVIIVAVPAVILYALLLLRRSVRASERAVQLLERERS